MPFVPARSAVITVLDFETTGTVPGWPVEPWQLGMVRLRAGRVCEQWESWLRVSPERPFNPSAPGRHAKLRGTLSVAPTLQELWPELSHWLSVPLAAHNIGTERTVLTKAFPIAAIGPWIDTLSLVRNAFPKMKSKALDDVTGELGLTERVRQLCPGREAHDALYDAVACAVLLEWFLALPGWENVAIENIASH